MKPLFSRNISNTGRLVRGLGALARLSLLGVSFGHYLEMAFEFVGKFEDFSPIVVWCRPSPFPARPPFG
jgi:hypothetical protein